MRRTWILRLWPRRFNSCSWQQAPLRAPSNLPPLLLKTTAGNLCKPSPESRLTTCLQVPKTSLVVLVVALALFGLGPPLSPLPRLRCPPSVCSFASPWRQLFVPHGQPEPGRQVFRQDVFSEESRRWSSPPLRSRSRIGAIRFLGTLPAPLRASTGIFPTSRRPLAHSGRALSATGGPLKPRLACPLGVQGRLSQRPKHGPFGARPGLCWTYRSLHCEGSRCGCSPRSLRSRAVHPGAPAPRWLLAGLAHGLRAPESAFCWCRARCPRHAWSFDYPGGAGCRGGRGRRREASGWREPFGASCGFGRKRCRPPGALRSGCRRSGGSLRPRASGPVSRCDFPFAAYPCLVPFHGTRASLLLHGSRGGGRVAPSSFRAGTGGGRGSTGGSGERSQGQARDYRPPAGPAGFTPRGHAEAHGPAGTAHNQAASLAASLRGSVCQPPRLCSSGPLCFPGRKVCQRLLRVSLGPLRGPGRPPTAPLMQELLLPSRRPRYQQP